MHLVIGCLVRNNELQRNVFNMMMLSIGLEHDKETETEQRSNHRDARDALERRDVREIGVAGA